jgi:hypothetical protein
MKYSRLGYVIFLIELAIPYALAGIFGIETFRHGWQSFILWVYIGFVIFVSPYFLERMIFQDKHPFKDN